MRRSVSLAARTATNRDPRSVIYDPFAQERDYRAISLALTGPPAGESSALPDGPETFFGVGSLVFRRHDEQFVPAFDPLPQIRVERPPVSNDQGHHRVLGQPKLAYFHPGEARFRRNANLQQ